MNLGAYYLVGTPIGAVLAFVFHLKGKGLWIGLLTGSSVQAILLALKTSLTNWQKQVLNLPKLKWIIINIQFWHLMIYLVIYDKDVIICILVHITIYNQNIVILLEKQKWINQ